MDNLVTKELLAQRKELIHPHFGQEEPSTDLCILLGSA